MSGIIDALYDLKYNPFKYGIHVSSFYSAVEESENNIFFSPLIIPLCSHPLFSNRLLRANIKSTVWTIFDDRSQFYDLQERIDNFQTLTMESIQYSLANDWLFINTEKLSFSINPEYNSLFTINKNAEKLGRLFSEHSVVEIYAFLGVKPI